MATSASQRLRRAAEKASRRKAVVAEKRKADAVLSGHGVHIVDAARAPVTSCGVSETIFDDGIGWVVLARTLPSRQVAASFFLVDVWCLGVKDAFFRVVPPLTFEDRMAEQPLVEIDPSIARKLLHDAVAYAQSLGLAPATDFARAEALFGDIPLAPQTFSFGQDGKPFFVSGPNDTRARIRNILDKLYQSVGPDGFDYLCEASVFG